MQDLGYPVKVLYNKTICLAHWTAYPKVKGKTKKLGPINALQI